MTSTSVRSDPPEEEIPVARRASRPRRQLQILAVAGIVTAVVLWLTRRDPNTVQRVSLATAYASTILLGWSLLIGPWSVLRGRRPRTNDPLRRDVGIWCAVLATAHTILGLQVHFGGDMTRYFWRGPLHWSGELAAFVLTNWIGLLLALAFILLGCISNDRALRSLGARRWKSLQRWAYALAALVAVHGLMYQLLEDRSRFVILGSIVGGVVVLALQLAGWRRHRRAGAPLRGERAT